MVTKLNLRKLRSGATSPVEAPAPTLTTTDPRTYEGQGTMQINGMDMGTGYVSFRTGHERGGEPRISDGHTRMQALAVAYGASPGTIQNLRLRDLAEVEREIRDREARMTASQRAAFDRLSEGTVTGRMSSRPTNIMAESIARGRRSFFSLEPGWDSRARSLSEEAAGDADRMLEALMQPIHLTPQQREQMSGRFSMPPSTPITERVQDAAQALAMSFLAAGSAISGTAERMRQLGVTVDSQRGILTFDSCPPGMSDMTVRMSYDIESSVDEHILGSLAAEWQDGFATQESSRAYERSAGRGRATSQLERRNAQRNARRTPISPLLQGLVRRAVPQPQCSDYQLMGFDLGNYPETRDNTSAGTTPPTEESPAPAAD